MAALLFEMAGGASHAPASPIRQDLRARSRVFLRRGLLLSGAIHLALVVAFLNLQGDAEVVIRTNSRPMDVFRQPSAEVVPLPPTTAGTVPPAQEEVGIIKPVPTPPLELPTLTKILGFPPIAGDPRPGRKGALPGDVGNGPVNPPLVDRVYFPGTVEVPPVAVEAPKPPYPPMARELEITGRVVAQVLVRPDGTVQRVEILSGNSILAKSVQETLYRWRFRPGRMGSQAVSVWVEIPVVFTL